MATTLDTGGIADSAGADHGPATSTSGDDTTRRTGHDTWSTRVRRPRALAAIVAVLALVVGGALWLVTRSGGSGAGASTTTQQIVTVTRGDVGSVVSAEGTIAAAQTDNLNFGSSGQVTAVNVKAGQQVTAGQVLATINSASLASSLSSAQANLATAQAKLSDDEASGASSDQINADQTSVQSATDSVSNAQQSLAGASLVATFNGTVAQVNVSVGEQLTGSGTGATTQTGTGTGSGQSSASLGSGSSGSFGGGAGGGGGSGGAGGSGSSSSSSSSSPAVQVISQGQYSVSLSVGTSDISRVAVGQPATLTVTTSSQTGGRGLFAQLFGGGAGRATAGGSGTGTGSGNGSASSAATGSTGPSATGSVTSVSAVATASSGVASYPVVVTFNADSNSFYPGATVTGSITTQAKNDVIEVPTRAISTQNGASVVTVSTNGKVGGPTETRTVTTGITAGGNTEITSGLKVGEHVVITLPSFFGGGTGGTGGRTFGGGGGAGSGAGGGTFGGSGGAGRGGNATSGSGSGG